jgi:hypothetical protein
MASGRKSQDCAGGIGAVVKNIFGLPKSVMIGKLLHPVTVYRGNTEEG